MIKVTQLMTTVTMLMDVVMVTTISVNYGSGGNRANVKLMITSITQTTVMMNILNAH